MPQLPLFEDWLVLVDRFDGAPSPLRVTDCPAGIGPVYIRFVLNDIYEFHPVPNRELLGAYREGNLSGLVDRVTSLGRLTPKTWKCALCLGHLMEGGRSVLNAR